MSLMVSPPVRLLTGVLVCEPLATSLSFRRKVYQQVHGTVMGSPVFVVVANLVIEDVEERALATFHSPPRLWSSPSTATSAVLSRVYNSR